MKDWYVPAELLGPGYKVRATLFDYQGNASETVEWGPFTLTDGSPPEAGVISPNGGEVWPLGTTQTIQWDITSPNGVDQVDIELISNNGSYRIAVNKPNTGRYDWEIPEEFLFAGNALKIKVFGEDNANFRQSFDISDNFFSIIDPTPDPDLPWSRPIVVTECPFGTTDFNYDSKVSSFYDNDGNLGVAYLCKSDTLIANNSRSIDEYIYVRRYNGGIWTEPELIKQITQITDNLLTNYKMLTDLQYKVDSANNGHMVWQDKVRNCNEGDQEIYYSTNRSGAWSDAQNISNNNTDSYWADFDLDHDNNVHVTWIDGRDCNGVGERNIYYRKNINGNWQNAEIIGHDRLSDVPEISVATDNSVNVVYLAGSMTQLQHLRYQGARWEAPEIAYNGQGNRHNELISGSEPGTLHYAFREIYNDPLLGTRRTRVLYSYFDGQQWQAAEEISPIVPGYNHDNVQLAIDEDGLINAIFVQTPANPPYTKRLFWTSQDLNGNWREPALVSLPTQYVVDLSPHLTSFANQLSATWVTLYSTEQHIVNSLADLNNIPLPPAEPEPEPEIVDEHPIDPPNLDPEPELDPEFIPDPVPEPGPENFIIDGDMESLGIEAWNILSIPNIFEKTGAAVKFGQQSLHIDSVLAGGGPSQSIQLEPGRWYNFSQVYKLLSGSMVISIWDQEGNNLITESFYDLANEWTDFSQGFYLDPNSSGQVNVMVYFANGEGYIDNLEIIFAN